MFLMMCGKATAKDLKNIKISFYCPSREVIKMADPVFREATWKTLSSQLHVDKVYLETHRDQQLVPEDVLLSVKSFFLEKGVEVGGGITFTIDESNNFETFSWTNPEHRKRAQEISAYTAAHFDDFILDDFFYEGVKSDGTISGKGNLRWPEYRTHLMTDAARECVILPAKKANPDVKAIIKFPNWYDCFPASGFDLEHEPMMFDGVWTGTETRNADSDQHLQPYHAFNAFHYFQNVSQGRNLGGWIDIPGENQYWDRYAEQVWITFLSGAKEIICSFDQNYRNKIDERFKAPWQDGKEKTSFSWKQMTEPVVQENGSRIRPTTLARATAIAAEKIDPIAGLLGNPTGIPSLKSFSSRGDDYLQSYLGMIGLPIDLRSDFKVPDKGVILLTEQAKDYDGLSDAIDAHLKGGGTVVVTSSFLKAAKDIVSRFVELRAESDVMVEDFGAFGKADRSFLLPRIEYYTNDSWQVIPAGRPLSGGTSGSPLLLRGDYSKGALYCLAIPEDYSDFYHLPQGVLDVIRRHLGASQEVVLEGPASVSLFLYDNQTLVVESFRNESVDVSLLVSEGYTAIEDLETLQRTSLGQARELPGRQRYHLPQRLSAEVHLPPHSFKAFRLIR